MRPRPPIRLNTPMLHVEPRHRDAHGPQVAPTADAGARTVKRGPEQPTCSGTRSRCSC